jgi:hypothetical protein
VGIDKLISSVKKYLKIEVDLFKLQAKEQVVEILSVFILIFLLLSFGLFIVFFLSITIAFYLNDLLDSRYLGLLIVAGFYTIICIVLVLMKDKLIAKGIFKAFFEGSLESVERKKRNDEY